LTLARTDAMTNEGSRVEDCSLHVMWREID
jgi:hypothetical protein